MYNTSGFASVDMGARGLNQGVEFQATPPQSDIQRQMSDLKLAIETLEKEVARAEAVMGPVMTSMNQCGTLQPTPPQPGASTGLGNQILDCSIRIHNMHRRLNEVLDAVSL